MPHPELLSSLRDALRLGDDQLLEVLALGGQTVEPEALPGVLAGGEAGTDAVLGGFLEGLILARRGVPAAGSPPRGPAKSLSNNAVLKKLRVALDLREPQLLALMAAGGVSLRPRELAALFRSPGHKNFRACSDETLQGFVAGVAAAAQD